MFFGGGGARQGGRKEMPKVKPTKKALEVTLEQIYNGEVIKIQHERSRCCENCKGKGGENVKSCNTCKGKGRVVQVLILLFRCFKWAQECTSKSRKLVILAREKGRLSLKAANASPVQARR